MRMSTAPLYGAFNFTRLRLSEPNIPLTIQDLVRSRVVQRLPCDDFRTQGLIDDWNPGISNLRGLFMVLSVTPGPDFCYLLNYIWGQSPILDTNGSPSLLELFSGLQQMLSGLRQHSSPSPTPRRGAGDPSSACNGACSASSVGGFSLTMRS